MLARHGARAADLRICQCQLGARDVPERHPDGAPDAVEPGCSGVVAVALVGRRGTLCRWMINGIN